MDNYYEVVDSKMIPEPSKRDLVRINSLKIPPNWKDVKISKDPKSKIQVIGRDSKDREQRLYHPDWIKKSNELIKDDIGDNIDEYTFDKTQIYQTNNIDLGCNRHMRVFNKFNVNWE